jgi:hypothetical protein
VANTGLVGLILEMKVFRAESEEHAQRIAKSVVGKALGDVPLKIIETKQLAERKGAAPEAPAQPAAPPRPAGAPKAAGQHPFGRRPAKR